MEARASDMIGNSLIGESSLALTFFQIDKDDKNQPLDSVSDTVRSWLPLI